MRKEAEGSLRLFGWEWQLDEIPIEQLMDVLCADPRRVGTW
jgi:hypothetical protein